MIRSCPIFGFGVKKKRARGCTACLVTTVVELILGGGCSFNDRTSGVLASGVRRTPDLSGIEKCGFEKEMSQKLRHVLLSESID